MHGLLAYVFGISVQKLINILYTTGKCFFNYFIYLPHGASSAVCRCPLCASFEFVCHFALCECQSVFLLNFLDRFPFCLFYSNILSKSQTDVPIFLVLFSSFSTHYLLRSDTNSIPLKISTAYIPMKCQIVQHALAASLHDTAFRMEFYNILLGRSFSIKINRCADF